MRIGPLLLATLLIVSLASGCGYSRPAAGATPQLTTLAPPNTAAGGPAFTLMVNGSGFAAGSVVYWNSTARTTAYVSAAQVTTQITVADIMTAGTASVYVHTPGGAYGGGANSNTVTFTIN